jgi:adenylyl cyclase-associated protein
MEKVSLENKIFHDKCFKCAHCKKTLTPGTYTAIENTFYCKPHYHQLFAAKGNYSEGFGKEKPTAAWSPSTASYEGVDLNKKDSKDSKEPVKDKPKPASGGPPPPPAPGDLLGNANKSGGDDPSAQSAALDAIRSGGHQLKHLTREERKQKPLSSVVPGNVKPKVVPKKEETASKAAVTGPPELKLDNSKWIVRYQQSKPDPINIKITDIKQSVTISDCKKCSFTIQGKLTNISVFNCAEVGVIFDDIIASVEVVRSTKLGIQANGKIAQIAVDKCSGVEIYIQSKAGKDVEIVTSLSDSLNVNYPGATPEDDPIEFPIPSQFTSVIEQGKLHTHPVEHV